MNHHFFIDSNFYSEKSYMLWIVCSGLFSVITFTETSRASKESYLHTFHATQGNTPHTRNQNIIAVYSYIERIVDIKGDGKMAENVVRKVFEQQNLCEVKPNNRGITASA